MFTHDMTGNVSEAAKKKSQAVSGMVIYDRFIIIYSLHCEADVDQEVATATSNEKRRSRRKEYSDLRAGGTGNRKKKKKFRGFLFLYWDENGNKDTHDNEADV